MGPNNNDAQDWHFEVPLDRRALRTRAVVAVTAALVLSVVGAEAAIAGAMPGVILGALGATGFSALAHRSWRLSRISGAPLVLDEQGLWLQDGFGPCAFLRWEQVRDVRLRRGRLARRVVLTVQGTETELDWALPPLCHAGAPPEWTAGLIETFRQHALHRW